MVCSSGTPEISTINGTWTSPGQLVCALPFAGDAEHVDVVPHEVWNSDFGRLAGKCRQTDATAAVDHARSFVDRVGRARTFDNVVYALATVELANRGDGVLVL